MWWCRRGEYGSFMERRGALQVYITFTTAGITILCNGVLVVLRVCQDGQWLEVIGMDEERQVQKVWTRRGVWRGGRRWGWGCVEEKEMWNWVWGRAKQIENATPIWHHSVVGEATWYKLELLVWFYCKTSYTTTQHTYTFTKWQSLVKHIHCISNMELEFSKGMHNLGICSIISGRWKYTLQWSEILIRQGGAILSVRLFRNQAWATLQEC